MATTDILIIGAGAAGLMAARELGKAGKKVIVLEARDRTGGRIHTLQDPAFDLPVELGAEFIHGDLQLTLQLLKEAGIEYYPIEGELWRSKNGTLEKQEDFLVDEKELLKKLKALEHDMSVRDFLNTYFTGEQYEDLRKSVISFVEGYDAADASYASCFSLLQEMLGETSPEQFRVKGGYVKLVDYLENECKKAGCLIELSSVVSAIRWASGNVTVTTRDKRTFSASKAIVTLPLSVLQCGPDEPAYVTISPLPQETYHAIRILGITGVIKIILQFDRSFWKKQAAIKTGRLNVSIGFVFSETAVPTWWTQLPEDNRMISGWLAGPPALLSKQLPEKEILQQALESLSQIFSVDTVDLRSWLRHYHVVNWTADNFTLGAYGYEKVESINAKRIINTPLENTLFFAGEAFHEGPEHGTVEGALRSAQLIASKILHPA
ncbi:MAG TPA: NAD(P)/FAD-dependent oxidoreductase [Chitinophagaceae bacterium]|nr:NAD(P)/FAD-dependent oxidoreductase [Chitinophagaceae bacterium]